MRVPREYLLGAVIALLLGGGLLYVFTRPVPDAMRLGATPSGGIPYTEIANPSGFVNTDGITIKELIGEKIVMVDFMTYSCINCQRTFPYMNAWYEKYKDQGLEIVGIHTPEFAFEKDKANVESAMKQFGITYPVVLDNEYGTWNAYGNRFWPRKYLIDIHGNVVYDHTGEGAYEETEMKIRELLAERAQVLGMEAPKDMAGALAASSVDAPTSAARSPETYLGSGRNEYLANGPQGTSGERRYVLPASFAANALYLGGTWDIAPEYAASVADARIVYRYSAKAVYLVMDAASPVEVEVWQDGARVGGAAGSDVNADGVVRVQESRLYRLIENAEPGAHVIELRVRGGGLRAYAFTFG